VEGPLGVFAEGFREELARQGYTPLSAAVHVRLMAHLDRWLVREGLDVSGLCPARVDAYFAERRAAGYVGERTSRALEPLLGYLRRLSVLPVFEAPAPATSVERLLACYREYLATERRLSPRTVELDVRLVRPFVLQRAAWCGGQFDPGGLAATDVNAFVTVASCRQPRSAKRIVTALRSLLVFLHVSGLKMLKTSGFRALFGAAPRPEKRRPC
jgi:hypothetical protein